jgi:hypothetical protein
VPTTSVSLAVFKFVRSTYSKRYQAKRRNRDQTSYILPSLPTILNYHNDEPDLFCEYLRVSPYTFDRFVEALESSPVFHNNSQHAQMPVSFQVAITLYRFGHYRNGVSLQKVADWAGIGKGTVENVTRRVIAAILRTSFRNCVMHTPTHEEKRRAKSWVRKHSCKAWRHGYCMVDGTLIPLDERPFWFGESYYNCKGNYLLNVQVSATSIYTMRC